MQSRGFYISRLEVRGEDKEPAVLDFKHGLNVIAGASDTGKSYILEVIDYALGRQQPPKDIPEAVGYDHVFLEIHNYKDEVVTINRSLYTGAYHIKCCSIDEYQDIAIVGQNLKQKGEDGISSFLLRFSGLEKIQLKKNLRNEKVTLSFRDIARIAVINEQMIIKDESPILSTEYTENIKNKNLFHYLISGRMEEIGDAIEDVKITKAKIESKIDLLESQRQSISQKLETAPEDSLEISGEHDWMMHLFHSNKKLSSMEGEREKKQKEVSNVNTKIASIESLTKRFSLLKKVYETDLHRLKFIQSGGKIFTQVGTRASSACPLCGGNCASSHSDITKAIDTGAIGAEINKINVLMQGLDTTFDDLSKEEDQLRKDLEECRHDVQRLNSDIAKELIIQSDVKRLLSRAAEKQKFDFLREELIELGAQQEKLRKLLQQTKKKTDAPSSIPPFDVDQFCLKISTLLKTWGLPKHSPIEFDSAKYDISIAGKPRRSFGKGVRAITISAFVIALMQQALESGAGHARFVILDSPLMNYREADKSNPENYSKDLYDAFYSQLSEMNSEQLIIFENQEPSSGIWEKINYVHFSGDSPSERNGFFPAIKTLNEFFER